jgi:hypothetical protein
MTATNVGHDPCNRRATVFSDLAPALAKLAAAAPIIAIVVAIAWVKVSRVRAGKA